MALLLYIVMNLFNYVLKCSCFVFGMVSLHVVVVSHIQRIGCQPEKTTLHGGQSRSWSAEQGKENKRKSLAAYRPPPTKMYSITVGFSPV